MLLVRSLPLLLRCCSPKETPTTSLRCCFERCRGGPWLQLRPRLLQDATIAPPSPPRTPALPGRIVVAVDEVALSSPQRTSMLASAPSANRLAAGAIVLAVALAFAVVGSRDPEDSEGLLLLWTTNALPAGKTTKSVTTAVTISPSRHNNNAVVCNGVGGNLRWEEKEVIQEHTK